MKIQIEIRWPRRPAWLVVAFALVLVAAVPVAWANDHFPDVPTSSPHHDDINAIADAGITVGCNPLGTTNLYCPADPVRRDQMASFLARGLPRIAVQRDFLAGGDTVTRGAAFTNVGQVTINVPGAGTQYVKVDASIAVYGTTNCECLFSMRIHDLSTNQFSDGGFSQKIPFSMGTASSHAAVGVFDASHGARTYRLEMRFDSSAGADPQHLFLVNLNLVATTYPFLSGDADVSSTGAAATGK